MRPKLTRELLAELFPRTVGAQQSPQEKTGVILRRAVNDPELLDAIQERACMRWEHGYSDSLMSAVLCDLTEIEEEREYTSTPDEKQAAFLRRLGNVLVYGSSRRPKQIGLLSLSDTVRNKYMPHAGEVQCEAFIFLSQYRFLTD